MQLRFLRKQKLGRAYFSVLPPEKTRTWIFIFHLPLVISQGHSQRLCIFHLSRILSGQAEIYSLPEPSGSDGNIGHGKVVKPDRMCDAVGSATLCY